MQRKLFLTIALAAFCLYPREGVALRDKDGEIIDPKPCEWVFSLEEGMAKAGDEKPIYIYFAREKSVKAMELPTRYMYNETMQKLSKNSAVFVLLSIPKKKRSDEVKALLKKYRINRIPAGVLTDRYGNLLTSASHTITNKLSREIRTARQVIAKTKKLLADHIKEGKAALEKGKPSMAKYHFKWVVDRYPDYPEHDIAAGLLAETKEKQKQENEKAAQARAEAAAAKKAAAPPELGDGL